MGLRVVCGRFAEVQIKGCRLSGTSWCLALRVLLGRNTVCGLKNLSAHSFGTFWGRGTSRPMQEHVPDSWVPHLQIFQLRRKPPVMPFTILCSVSCRGPFGPLSFPPRPSCEILAIGSSRSLPGRGCRVGTTGWVHLD